MDHPIKGKWHSYLIQTSPNGTTAAIQADGANHVMDLMGMDDQGHLAQGTHNGKTISGDATADGDSYKLVLKYADGTRTYEGMLVRDKTIGGQQIKLVAGRFIFLKQFDDKELFRVGDIGLLTTQEEGTWVITRP